MDAVPWLLFALAIGAVFAWSLSTGVAWHWGDRITRNQNPSEYFQFLLVLVLGVSFALVAAYQVLGR